MANEGVSRRHFFYGALLAGAVPTGGFGSTPSLKHLGYKSPERETEHRRDRRGRQGQQRHRRMLRPRTSSPWPTRIPSAPSETFAAYPERPQVHRLPEDARQGGRQHRRRHGLLSRPHARHAPPCGRWSAASTSIVRSRSPAPFGRRSSSRWRPRSTGSRRRWATRATRSPARASAPRSSGAATSATSPRSTPGRIVPRHIGRRGRRWSRRKRRSRDTRLGGLARRLGAAPVQPRVRAAQLARVPRFRLRRGRRHGLPHPGHAQYGDAARAPDQRRVRQARGQGEVHVPVPDARSAATSLPAARCRP